jgi:ferredoxin
VPRLVFERTRFEVDLPDGGRVLDVCDAHFMAGVAFACRHANCGICRVELVEGADLCEPADDDERHLTEGVFRHDATVRLACQLRVRAGHGVVRLRVVR